MKQLVSRKAPNIRVTVAHSTRDVLAQLASAPREIFIHLSRTAPDTVRALSDTDTKKLFTKITATEIAQLIIRTWLRQIVPPSSSSLPDPETLHDLLARRVIHDHPETHAKVLRTDSNTIKKSRPFEKRPKYLIITLTSAENSTFRSLAARMRVGPSELGGLLLERFAHQFPASVTPHASRTTPHASRTTPHPSRTTPHA
jgi:hypothetical protein